MITDYTEQNTLGKGISQQYRIMKYFKDIINNWLADPINIKDSRLAFLLYDANGNLNKDCVKTGTSFDPDEQYHGTSPAIIISLGDITYIRRNLGPGSTPGFNSNPMLPVASDFKFKNIPLQITVITQNNDGTILLAQLIQVFIGINCNSFVADNPNICSFNLTGVSKPQQIKASQLGNAKDLYVSQISMNAVSTLVWSVDSQGPVFKGITNINKEQIYDH